jgi:hypothetical protein
MTVKMSDIVTFDVSDAMIEQAKRMRNERDKIYGNIFKERESDLRWVGDLGEIVIDYALRQCRPKETIWHNQLHAAGDHDFTFCGLPLEVKTVKRKVPLRPHYKAQITARHMESPAPWLIFASYEFPQKKMHIKGVMHKIEFKQKAEYFEAGEKVHEHYTIADGHEIYAVGIRDMRPFREFLSQAMKGTLKEPIELTTAV